MININRFSIKNVKTKRVFMFAKVITFFLILGINAAYASSYSQNTKISLHLKNKAIKELFNEIEKNSEYIFFYQDASIDAGTKVSVDAKDKTLNEILDQAFTNTGYAYKISDRQVLISRKTTNSKVDQPEQNNKMIIRGNVSDMQGLPLIGATVSVKNTKTVAVTDIDGNFSIDIPDKYAVIEVRYIGYIPREETVGNRQIINFILEEDIGQLDDIVVVGYGTQKKESVVGSISTITPRELNTGTTRSISNNLAGNIAGVIGVQRSGEPGYDNSSFWIRGISTFQSAKNPLILIDGIERSLNNISIEEIESFSVLKDAAASAVYGVRGANGVILITTKRGQVGKPQIKARVEHSFTKPVKLPEFLGAADYMQLLNNLSQENGGGLPYSEEAIYRTRTGYDWELYPDINWMDAITKDNGSNTRASLDISGGTERLRYSFILSYFGENGIIAKDKRREWSSDLTVRRYNVRTNVDYNLTTTTLLRLNIGGYMQDRKSPPGSINDLFGQAFVTPPHVHPTQYSTGEIPQVVGRVNPWAIATQTGYKDTNNMKFESIIELEQSLKFILPGLKFKGLFSFDTYTTTYVTREGKPYYYDPAKTRDPETGELELGKPINEDGKDFLEYKKEADWGHNSKYLEWSFSYDQTFNQKHNVHAMFLYNQREYKDGSKVPSRRQGIAGRTSYIFNSRYIAEFNFGYNGSENLSKKHRFGFFPSVALGWIVTEEEFMQPATKILSKLKIRGSYGLVGNDQFDRKFAYITELSESNEGYAWGNDANYTRYERMEGHPGVTNLKWETVAKTNIGLEVGLLRNAIDLQIDWFKENRRDIFQKRVNFPNSAGFVQLPYANFGKVDNTGVDISLMVNKSLTKDLHIGVRGTFTYAKNKIIEQDEDMGKIGTNRQRTGHSVNQIFGLVADGLYTEADFIDIENGILADGLPVPEFKDQRNLKPGDIKYLDLDNNGIINSMDETAIGGTWDPEIIYGFGLSLAYKSIDLGVNFQGSGRTYSMIGRGNEFMPGSNMGTTGNIYANALNDRWKPDNPRQDAFYPRLTYGRDTHNSQSSTWWLKNMSMLRMKNLEVGYSFPKNWIRNIALSNARVFVRGTNLLTFSDFKLWDPEVSSKDSNGLSYPINKSLSFGLELNF